MKRKIIDLLNILNLTPSTRSVDYVENKTQFQLHSLLTEQRHPLTWNLSQVIKRDTAAGLKRLLLVDQDISKKLSLMAQSAQEGAVLEQAAQAIVGAINRGQKIFFYGCGSTGRLAKFMESSLWRPFWRRLKRSAQGRKVLASFPSDIEECLVGEMTGGDRALVSALEGFEDLQIIGRLQVLERRVQRGDVVFGVTEGGETSSVIGAILAAAEMWEQKKSSWNEARKHLYFIYNNPDDVLRPFDRSRAVLDHPAITKICLATGPQAITGSTRMQATTAETYVLGLILERVIYLLLSRVLNRKELGELGFKTGVDIERGLEEFAALPMALLSKVKEIASLSELEARVYEQKKRTTYFAKKALLTVFIDGAERSPTFHLQSLDPVTEKRRSCWFQVWTEAANKLQAWRRLLNRRFRGLEKEFYQSALAAGVSDPYLRQVALSSLLKAGDDQQHLYDFSLSERNLGAKSLKRGELGIMVGLNEEIEELNRIKSSWSFFARLCRQKGASLALVFAGLDSEKVFLKKAKIFAASFDQSVFIFIPSPLLSDPLQLKQQILLKMLLNAHSTAIMARLGRVVGNTMTFVNPSNLKLIGRATYLIMSHVNDTLNSPEWRKRYGRSQLITYAEANALLFDALENAAGRASQRSEVELSIIRALEACRQKSFVSWEKAEKIAQSKGLEAYLMRLNPRLRSSAKG